MQYHPLGQTNLQVSQMVLGGAQFGQQYGPVSFEDAHAVVMAALDAGVNLIDTSAYYGRGESERILGEILKNGGRDRVAICTKAGRLDRDQFDFTPTGMRQCLEASLRRLQTDYVDILLAHDIEFADNPEQVFTETAGVLHELKQAGLVRYVGMSCLPLPLLRTAIERCTLDVVISYCHYTLQNQQLLDDLLPIADAHGVGVMNASPLAMGLLTHAGPPSWHPANVQIRSVCREAAAYCHEHGADLAMLGMQYCFAQPRLSCTITGAATLDQLQMNLAAMDTAPDAELLAKVLEILEPIRNCSITG